MRTPLVLAVSLFFLSHPSWAQGTRVVDEGSFTTTLIGLKTAYSFTPRIYLQSLIQYNDQTRSLSGNVRFGWLGPAGTGLFVVYNEGRQTGPGSGPLDRALVVKFTRQVEVF